jgi:L-malate glycosyltransferase
MRVLWVIKGLGPGGAETLLAAAARAHDPERFHIECAYVLPYKDHLAGALESAGVTTHCLAPRGRRSLWPLTLARLVRHGNWDVVHIHSPLPGAVARLATRIMRKRPRIVTTEHNAWGTFSTPTRWVNRATSRWNDVTFAVSNEVRTSMAGADARRATVLVHGIDVAATAALADQRTSVRRELGISDDRIVIGTVANFRPQKDYPNLLAAARAVVDAGVKAHFVIVGQGPLETETRALAERLGLASHVTFTGFRADATRVMAAFDVFVLASRWEGLPVALMEATALGLPIVATDVGGVAETLHHDVDALLVPAGDPVELAVALERVVTDEDLRKQLAQASAGRSVEFDAARTQRAVEATYGEPRFPVEVVASTSATRKSPASTGLDIREATPADRDAILALTRRSLGWTDDPRFEQLFRWKHDENPNGPSPMWVAVDGDRVVAVRAFMRWTFIRGGHELRAVRAVDTATDPDYQGRGLFRALTLHGVDAMRKEGVDFVFNTPNAQSKPGYLKMGWREVGALPAAIRPRLSPSIMHLGKARVPAEHWSEPLDIGVSFASWSERNECPPPSDNTNVRAISTLRSPAFLRWRYGTPLLHYRVMEAHGGAVVVRARRRGKALELVHVASLGLGEQEADQIVTRALRRLGAHHALRLGPTDLRHGFVPFTGPMLTWRALASDGLPPLDNWQLTMGDIELF